ncbi:MAG: 30S ribosomal protein S15 [Candidatus Nanohaloarchaeota archaeon QJJ-5]|nr:30S ribosomal protein S15 [Candidatus Nanohaloarchaeota archaeon QJJ-5]
MARMHSEQRGQSGSTKPKTMDTSWVTYDSDEVEQLVVKLANQGHRASDIGRILRDRYGIPDVQAMTGQAVTDILDAEDLGTDLPEDLQNLIDRAVSIRDHLDENQNDLEAQRSLDLIESKVRRLADYYRGDELDDDWTYTPERHR